MKLWITKIIAINPKDPSQGPIEWAGPDVPGLTLNHAQAYCNDNGLGYCQVVGQLISHIPCKPNSNIPDFSKKTSFYNPPDN